MSTYCPLLWNSVTLDQLGNVFSCCHIKPGKLGNIYQSSHKDIINNAEIQKFRQDSLDGTLYCYQSCNLFDKAKYHSPNLLDTRVNISDITSIHIHFGKKCNIKCIMCNHPVIFKQNPIILDAQSLIDHIDFSFFNEIVIQGGEPLFIDECVKFIKYLSSMMKPFTLLTNGILIQGEIVDILAKNNNKVVISINGSKPETHELINKGSRFETLITNIKNLREKRTFYNSNLEIIGRMTINPETLHDIPNFLAVFQDLGFDKANFGYVKETVPSYLEDNIDFTENLIQEIDTVLPTINENSVDILRLKQLNLIQ